MLGKFSISSVVASRKFVCFVLRVFGVHHPNCNVTTETGNNHRAIVFTRREASVVAGGDRI